MSIFTRTTDEAIDRFTLEDGTEVAVGYDHDAEEPFQQSDAWSHMAIRRAGTGINEWFGDERLGRDWDGWENFEGSGLTPEEAECWFRYTTECPGKSFDITVTDLYGWPEFQVVIGNVFWEHHGIDYSEERAQKEAEELAKTWGAWAEGSVYLIEVEHPDGEVQYVGGIYGDVTKANVREYL